MSSPDSAMTAAAATAEDPALEQRQHEQQLPVEQDDERNRDTQLDIVEATISTASKNYFWLDLFSKTLFFIASFCYVAVAAVGLTHPLRGTKFMLISLFAAFLFAVVGVIDLVILPRIMGVIMILAGVFGVLSVAFVTSDLMASKALNCVSVHLFLIEAVCQFVIQRSEVGRALRVFLRSGDIFWIFGSLTDVILSYISLRGSYADSEAGAAMFSACLWLASSLVYLSAVIYVRVNGDSNSSSSNIIADDLEMTVEATNQDPIVPESKIV
jgi:hypothetical protein